MEMTKIAILTSIMQILMVVETQGNADAIGDNGTAFGILQIRSICVRDVNRIYKVNFEHKKMFDVETSKNVFMAYMGHGWAHFVKRHGYDPSEQDLVRMWNGGIYTGYQRESTEPYYQKYLELKKQLK